MKVENMLKLFPGGVDLSGIIKTDGIKAKAIYHTNRLYT